MTHPRCLTRRIKAPDLIPYDASPVAAARNSRVLDREIYGNVNVDGAFLELPRAFVWLKRNLPPITAMVGGLAGAGCGTDLVADGDCSHGTVLRPMAASGDLISLAGAHNCILQDFAVWHVNARIGGRTIAVAERVEGGAVVARPHRNHIKRIQDFFPWETLAVVNGVYTRAKQIRSFAAHGSRAYYVSGSPTVLSQHNEDAKFEDIHSEVPQQHELSIEPGNVVTHAGGLFIAAGKYFVKNGYWWQATSAGTTDASGAGPALPALDSAQAITTVRVMDGTLVVARHCRADFVGFDAESGGDYVRIAESFLNQGVSAVRARNSFPGGTRLKILKITGCPLDHFLGDICRIEAATRPEIVGNALESSIGAGIYFGADTSQRVFRPNFFNANAGGQIVDGATPPADDPVILNEGPGGQFFSGVGSDGVPYHVLKKPGAPLRQYRDAIDIYGNRIVRDDGNGSETVIKAAS